MNYEESVRSLLALGRELGAPQQARVQKFGLDNIRVLSAALGSPHLVIPCVHVAGTNGKGSTAAMLESILRAAGFRTGLYTSPHLERINERIRINGEEISDEAFAAAWTRVQSAIESLMASGTLAAHPTFFECVTAIAFVAFQNVDAFGLDEDCQSDRRDSARRAEAEESLFRSNPAIEEKVRALGRQGRSQTRPPETLDVCVYEVGLGGRLDSTNIVEPEVAVITPVDFDHENFLGHSILEIAAEKAGIIKPGSWVVSASQRPEARAVIARRAQELGARFVETEAVWRLSELTSRDGRYRTLASVEAQGFSPRKGSAGTNRAFALAPTNRRETTSAGAAVREIPIAPSLPGKFQIQNALTAATGALLLRQRGFAISDEAISAGIASVRWPGRLERLSDRPAVYLDGAHNPAAVRELKNFWHENFVGRRIILIFGAMRDKAVDEIAGVLFPMADRVILTQPRQPRAISAPLLAEMTAGLARHATVIADPAEALENALAAAGPDDVICVTGSLFLVGDLRRHWRTRSAPNPPQASEGRAMSQ
jgi:dihydrofolate synthase / folylpolyglutamate synthase